MRSTMLYGSNKRRKWNKQRVIQEIKNLPHRHSTWVKHNNNALWKAAVRYFDSWGTAVEAAGYDYGSIKQTGPSGPPPNKGAGGTCATPGCNSLHHAKGLCKRCYSIDVRQQKLQNRASGTSKTNN